MRIGGVEETEVAMRAKLSDSISVLMMMCLMLGFLAGFSVLPAGAEELPLRFNAVAVNMSNVGPRTQQRLDIVINRLSTDEERAKLMEALKSHSRRGDRELADTLFSKDSVGTIREVQRLAYDLRYARVFPMEGGGMQVIAATDRPLAFAETWRSSRTLDYNVSLLILEVDAEGQGEGQLMLGAEFQWDEEKNQVVITNFASEPVRLTSVRRR
jgi:hypothetical protein